MGRGLQYACAGVLLGGALLFSTGCVATVGGGGGVYYDYDYYPDWDAYYYPAGHVYYWNEGGAWRSGAHLPDRFHGSPAHTTHFRGHTSQPWTERR